MRILQICNKPPFPSLDGGSIAMGAMAKSMVLNGYSVDILSMTSFKHIANEKDVPGEYLDKLSIQYLNVDLRIKIFDAFINLFTGKSYHVQRFISEKMEQKIIELITSNNYDIIQFETVFIAPYLDIIRKNCNAKVILRMHNIEYQIWDRTAEREKNPLKKWYYGVLARRLRQYETSVFNKFDGIITISEEDQSKLLDHGCKVVIKNIPLGLDQNEYKVHPGEHGGRFPTLFHLGAMDWIPNQLALDWFLDQVWPKILAKFPHLKFHIAGRKMPQRFFNRQSDNLVVEAEIDDSKRFFFDKDIMIVPLRSGSGLRVKIIEGMALGKAIITTSIGASGIDYTPGENVLVADSEEEFFEAISACITDNDLVHELGRNARTLFEKRYQLSGVAEELATFYDSI